MFCLFVLKDCGSGIGRITKHLLLPLFTNVDMVEQNKEFLDQAPKYLVNAVCVHGDTVMYCIVPVVICACTLQ